MAVALSSVISSGSAPASGAGNEHVPVVQTINDAVKSPYGVEVVPGIEGIKEVLIVGADGFGKQNIPIFQGLLEKALKLAASKWRER